MNVISALIALPIPIAHSEPAGGAALGQVAIATAIGLLGIGAIVGLCYGHRTGRFRYLGTASDRAERALSLPGWAALPSLVSMVSLLVALFGMYWDISFHIDAGRDPGPLANPAHYFILAGLFGISSAGAF